VAVALDHLAVAAARSPAFRAAHRAPRQPGALRPAAVSRADAG
jgi:hypothetical protein